MEVAAFRAQARVRPEAHFQQQVAGLTAAETGRALARQTDDLAFVHADGNFHVEGAGRHAQLAMGVDLRHLQAELARGTGEGVLDVQQHTCMGVLAVRGKAAPARAAEQLAEEVAELRGLVGREAARGKVEALAPVRRRAEFLACVVALAEAVVGGAPLGVGEHRIGLVDFLHAHLGVRFLRYVRMVLARKAAEGLLDLVRRRFSAHPERMVVVMVFHAIPTCCDL